MPKGIGQRGIGSRPGIGKRQIANRYGLSDYPVPYLYPAGTSTFTVPLNGNWRFAIWGVGAGGVSGSNAGASGSLYVAVRALRAGQTVTIVVSKQEGVASTVTLPTGEVLSAGSASGSTPGAATANRPGDIVVQGAAGGGNPGAGADGPTSDTFHGGAGGASGANQGGIPGAGGGCNGTNVGGLAPGLAIIARARD